MAAKSQRAVRTLENVPALTGVRGLAIAVVVAGHAFATSGRGGLPGFFVGVDLFFVLSGFLITALLVAEWSERGEIRLLRFYVRRALRLLPALGAFVLVALALVPFFQPADGRGAVLRALAAAVAYASNIVYATHPGSPLGHLWSLAEEEQFYLVWPVALALLLRRGAGRRWILGVLVGALALDVGLRAALYELASGTAGQPVFLRISPLRSDGLIVGCVLALLWAWRLIPPPRGRLWPVVTVAAVVAYLGVAHFVAADAAGLYLGGWTLVAIVCAAIVYGCVAPSRAAPIRVLASRPATYLGRISYALYIWHLPLITLWPGRLMPVPARVAVSVVLAVLSFHLVEKPFLRRKARFAATAQQRDVVVAPRSPDARS